MALTGTLQDLGVEDLVQFPVIGKKTGELVVAGLDDDARLYYKEGQLLHLTCGEHVGLEALIDLVSFAEGEFEFRQGIATDTVSVETELHAFLEEAIQKRDARFAQKAAEAQKAADAHKNIAGQQATTTFQSSQAQQALSNKELPEAISQTALRFDYVESAALFGFDGTLVTSWCRDQVDDHFEAMIEEVVSIVSTHPRQGLQKVYLTDTKGTSIAAVVNEHLILLLSANDLSSLGMVSIASSKIVSSILKKIA